MKRVRQYVKALRFCSRYGATMKLNKAYTHLTYFFCPKHGSALKASFTLLKEFLPKRVIRVTVRCKHCGLEKTRLVLLDKARYLRRCVAFDEPEKFYLMEISLGELLMELMNTIKERG